MNATEHLVIIDSRFLQRIGAVRQQAINWANVDPNLGRHVVSLGHSELSFKIPSTRK